MSIPKRKIGMYALSLRESRKDDSIVDPSKIIDVLEYVASLGEDARIRKYAASSRAHLLMDLTLEIKSRKVYSLVIASAKYNHRPDLIDTETAKVRSSPKLLTEGEKEKTHLVLLVGDDEIIVLLEERQAGIGIKSFVSYINFFAKEFARKNGAVWPHILEDQIIPKGDFLTELAALKRVSLAEVVANKMFLKSEFGSYSGRYEEIQDKIEIKIKALKNKDIYDFAKDTHKRHRAGEFSRLRVLGYSENNDLVKLDTDLIKTVHHLNIELDSITGEVNTKMLISKMKDVLLSYRS